MNDEQKPRDLLSRLTLEQKDEIIKQAVESCKWIGHFHKDQPGWPLGDLKALIEKHSGLEIEEYT